MTKNRPKNNVRNTPDHNIEHSITEYYPAMIMALLVGFTFSPILWNQFVGWDDYDNLVDNIAYRGLGWVQLRWMFTTFHMGPYQPLSWLSYAIDYLIWGLNPLGYHLTNLIIHVANAVFFYFIGRRILSSALALRDAGPLSQVSLSAAFAALLFAIHPLRVESVAWATERRDVLSGFFYFATIYCYLRGSSLVVSSRRWFYATIVLYALSLLSKAITMTLPIVLLLLDVYPLRRIQGSPANWLKPQYRRILRQKLPFLLLAVFFAILALLGQKSTGMLKPLQHYSIASRVAQSFYGITFYIYKTFFPVGLSPLYELPYDVKPWLSVFIAAAIMTLLVSFATYFLRLRYPALLASWVYYVVVIAPMLGLTQAGAQIAADRYTYLACLSWDLLISGSLFFYWFSANANKHGRHGVPAITVVVVLVLGVLTWRQTQVWHDTRSLWEYVIAVTPDSSIAHYNLARTLEAEGNTDRAMELYSRAASLNPTLADAHYNLARLLARIGRQEEAIAHYRQALAMKPDDAETRNNLALLLAVRGNTNESLAELQKAVQIDPNYAPAYFNMGRIFVAQGELSKAVVNFEHALKINPNEVEILLAAGNALARQGNFRAATIHLRRAVNLKPESADARVALARSLEAQAKKEEAEKQYEAALRLMRSQSGTAPRR